MERIRTRNTGRGTSGSPEPVNRSSCAPPQETSASSGSPTVLYVGPEPLYAHEGDSGADLAASENCLIEARSWALVKTGLKIAVPEGYEAQVRPRSGMALKYGLTVLNTPGTVDSNYRGEVGVIVMNHNERAILIKRGERVAQLVIVPVAHATFERVEELPDTDRGAGGFGSTGV